MQNHQTRRLSCILLALSGALLSTQVNASKNTGQLIVHFYGLDSNDGELGASIVNSAEHFLGDYRKSSRFIRTRIVNQQVTWVIIRLPYGEYAISAYHDENKNKRYDLNLLGIPVEGYGFSNNVKVKFSAPEYQQAKFNFDKNGQVINIEIRDFSLVEKGQ